MPRRWIKAVARQQWRNPLFKHLFDWASEFFRNDDGVIQQGAGKGLRFNPGGTNAGFLLGTSEPRVQRALQLLLRPGMTFYDVGANVGFHSVIGAKLVGPGGGTVLCFEPLEKNAAQIEHNAALNDFHHIVVRHEALGDSDNEARFLLSTRSSWGVLASAGREPSGYTGRDITVRMRRLDSVIGKDHLPPPHLVKIDVEGAEAAVLRGGMRTLRVHRPVLLIELHGTNTPVAELLAASDYRSSVLGTTASVIDSPWNAYVIAIPAERREFGRTLAELCRPGGDRR